MTASNVPQHPERQLMRKGVDFPGVAVVFICHDGRGRFIMSKRTANARDEHGRWDIGGGGLELHATVEETLRLEIRDEYHTEVLGYEFLGYRDVHRALADGSPTHWIALDFAVRVNPATVQNGEPHKFDAVEWFTLATLPPRDAIHSQLPHFLEKYRDALDRILTHTPVTV